MITVYQYVHEKIIKEREKIRNYLLGPLDEDLSDEYKPIRELYYNGSEKEKAFVEGMIIKTANDILFKQLEKIDRLRFLENGKDMFSLMLNPKEYQDNSVFIPENLSFCSVMGELFEEEKNNTAPPFVY